MTSAVARRVQRAFSRAADSYDAAADIQRQVLDQLMSRLPAETAPTRIVDLGCGTGYAFAGLSRRYPAARLIGLDFAESMLRRAPDLPHLQKIAGNATALPLADASADLVISSLTYQWCALDRALVEARRVLQPGGTLAFSTLTGATFGELRQAFAGIDDAPHVLPLLKPEAILGEVARAGLGDATVFRACSVARFASVRALFDSIRRTGASEVAPQDGRAGRRRGLLGKTAYATIEARLLAQADADGHLPLSYDVLYVVARRPGERMDVKPTGQPEART